MIGPLVMFFACATAPANSNPEIPVADCKLYHKMMEQKQQQQENAPAKESGNSNPATISVPAAPSGTATPDNNPAY